MRRFEEDQWHEPPVESDHEDSRRLFREIDKLPCIIEIRGHRLFAQHILPAPQHHPRNGRMRVVRSRQHEHTVAGRRRGHLRRIHVPLADAIPPGKRRDGIVIDVADRSDLSALDREKGGDVGREDDGLRTPVLSHPCSARQYLVPH